MSPPIESKDTVARSLFYRGSSVLIACWIGLLTLSITSVGSVGRAHAQSPTFTPTPSLPLIGNDNADQLKAIRLDGGKAIGVKALRISPDNKLLTAIELDGPNIMYFAKSWDLQTKQPMQSISIRPIDSADSAFFIISPDGRYVAKGGVGHRTLQESVAVYDMLLGTESDLDVYGAPAWFTSDSKTLVIFARGGDFSVYTYKVMSGERRRLYDGRQPVGPGFPTQLPLQLSSDLSLVIIKDIDVDFNLHPPARLLDAVTGKIRSDLVNGNDVEWLEFSPDSHYLLISDTAGIRMLDIRTREPIMTFATADKIYDFSTCFFSPDSQYIALRLNTETRVFNLKSGQQIGILPQAVSDLVFSRDSKTLFLPTAERKTIVWDIIANRARAVVPAEIPYYLPTQWTLNSDSRILAVVNGAKLDLWSTDTGKLLATYHDHLDAIEALTFNVNGNLLASGDRNGTILIWSVSPQ